MARVVVGLSGGVDSSVAAYLLKEQGHDVVGLFMVNWHDTTGTLEGDCPWHDDRLFAELVARRLDIPLHVVDLSADYRTRVVDYMFAEYARGRTPNPDVLCNREIKFDVFLKEALKFGADYVATGHYCRKSEEPAPDGGTVCRLLAGSDPNKDQSYFLCQLTQEQLRYALFPVGDLLKPEVRRIAEEQHLATARRKDSQGICFVGKVDLPVFLQQKLAAREGNIHEIKAEWPKYNRPLPGGALRPGPAVESTEADGSPQYVLPATVAAGGTTPPDNGCGDARPGGPALSPAEDAVHGTGSGEAPQYGPSAAENAVPGTTASIDKAPLCGAESTAVIANRDKAPLCGAEDAVPDDSRRCVHRSDAAENAIPAASQPSTERLAALAEPWRYTVRDGRKIGTHRGAHFYTVGQRKGLGIGGRRESLFILATDVAQNVLYVGEGDAHPGLWRPALRIDPAEVHWLDPQQAMRPGDSRRYSVRIRYRQPLQQATLYRRDGGLYILFDQPQRGIAPGQFAAWYDGDELVGSGVIDA